MDWLHAQQKKIEKKLAERHLREGGTAIYDLSSSWVEGAQCELAAFGYSRDGKRGRMQIEYGLLTDPDGRPVGIDLFQGNTADATAFKTAISKVRDAFGLKDLVFAGDRGMITRTRVEDLRALEGAGWVTAMKAPDIAALAADDGPLQLSLIAATETDLEKIRASVQAGRLKEKDKTEIRVGKVIGKHKVGKHKVGKHFLCEIGDGSFTFGRDEEKIAAEARLDGIYVIRAARIPGRRTRRASSESTRTSNTSNGTSRPSKSTTSISGPSGITWPPG